MRNRFLRISAVAASATLALALVGALTLLLGSASGAPAGSMPNEAQAAENPSVQALRAISIPFGISSSLILSNEGRHLHATGHGVCWEEGQMFDLRVRVAQSTTNAFAEARSIDICDGGARQTWVSEAETQSRQAFAEGPARACAEAIEYAKHGIGDEYRWCKDVQLSTAEIAE